jgi:ribosomal protein L35
MNDQPHIHNVEIKDYGWFWNVGYGDQSEFIYRPWFLKRLRENGKLKRGIARLIHKHDKASKNEKARRIQEQSVVPDLAAGRWGSEQLPSRWYRLKKLFI